MTKILSIELCIISARGLGHKSSLLKPQWFSVAWVHPNSKYCTKVDVSGNSDANWGTKFSFSVDEHDVGSQRMELTVEVYRREPIFLREHLQGTAVVQMKEYLDKFILGEEHPGFIEETASFQLRRKKSDRPHGFVDLSIRICKGEDNYSHISGQHAGLKYPDQSSITLAIEDGPVYNYPSQPSSHFRGYSQDDDSYRNSKAVTQVTCPDPSGSTYGYQPPITLPTQASNPSYVPPLQYPGKEQVTQSYINMPPRRFRDQNNIPNFGMGLGAGALAAGTMIFGENHLHSPSYSAGFDDTTLTLSTDAPF